MNKRVTLSFDNGPHTVGTPALLKLLADRNLKAVFFLVAERLRDPELRALAEQTRAAGHKIANHSLTHTVALGRRPGAEAAELEIGSAQRLLGDLASGLLFRPNGEKGQLGPHLLSRDAVDYLEQNGYTAVHWNCVPRDWELPDDGWVARAEATIARQDWTLIVLHDHCLAGMQHLGGFLDRLIAQGVEFSQAMPPDCVMIEDGRPTPALQGMFTEAEAGV